MALGLFVLESLSEHLEGVERLLLDQASTAAEIRLYYCSKLGKRKLAHLAFLFSKLV